MARQRFRPVAPAHGQSPCPALRAPRGQRLDRARDAECTEWEGQDALALRGLHRLHRNRPHHRQVPPLLWHRGRRQLPSVGGCKLGHAAGLGLESWEVGHGLLALELGRRARALGGPDTPRAAPGPGPLEPRRPGTAEPGRPKREPERWEPAAPGAGTGRARGQPGSARAHESAGPGVAAASRQPTPARGGTGSVEIPQLRHRGCRQSLRGGPEGGLGRGGACGRTGSGGAWAAVRRAGGIASTDQGWQHVHRLHGTGAFRRLAGLQPRLLRGLPHRPHPGAR
mmetsp:Transcript_35533/g.115072  ORF Transcript_35533/g.115072 Transcript_35533/m.115072 type:complete len:283 (-) Transcript_35533:1592-2440(-)